MRALGGTLVLVCGKQVQPAGCDRVLQGAARVEELEEPNATNMPTSVPTTTSGIVSGKEGRVPRCRNEPIVNRWFEVKVVADGGEMKVRVELVK